MKKESMIGRRLYAWLIDTFLLFVLVFFIDGLISTPIMNNITNIQSILDLYVINSEIYNYLQDEYELYIYDENNNRINNENISEEKKEAFLNDERVIEITNVLYDEQTILLKTIIIRVSLSILGGALIVYIILPLCLSKGRTLGKLIAKLVVINKNKEYVSWYQVLLRYSLSIVFNIYLAIISLGIIPIINLLIAIVNKKIKHCMI